jgi:hypothetical protein
MAEFGDIKGETWSTVVAAQDQTLNCFKKNILRDGLHSKCWLCRKYKEITDHLTSRCPILEKTNTS